MDALSKLYAFYMKARGPEISYIDWDLSQTFWGDVYAGCRIFHEPWKFHFFAPLHDYTPIYLKNLLWNLEGYPDDQIKTTAQNPV